MSDKFKHYLDTLKWRQQELNDARNRNDIGGCIAVMADTLAVQRLLLEALVEEVSNNG